MASHDYVIANGTGAAVRADLNNALAAIVSNNSGSSEPATMYAYQWWADTTSGSLKQRNAANNAWITIGTLASANLGLVPLNGAGGTPSSLTLTNATGLPVAGGGTGAATFAANGILFGNGTGAVGVTAVGTATHVLTSNGSGSAPTFQAASSTSDKISEGNTEAEVVDTGSDGHFKVTTEGTERFRADNSGNLLVGLTSAVGIGGTPADLNSTEIGRGYINISRDDTSAADHIQFGKNGSVASSIGTSTTNSLVFKTGTTERMRIDSSGNAFIGGTTASNADIALNANGSATFANGLINLAANGGVVLGTAGTANGVNFTMIAGTSPAASAYTLQQGLQSDGTTVAYSFKANGNITAAGNLRVGDATETAGSTYGILDPSGQVIVQNNIGTDAKMVFAALSGPFSVASNRRIMLFADGSGTFAGAVTATNTAKAWVNFNGTGTVAIRANHNVSSITDNATGDYTINFSSSLADANYAVTSIGQNVSGVGNNGTSHIYDASAPTASAVRILFSIGNSPFDPTYGNIAIFR